VTPELEAEGVRNDFVRLVQQARKDAGLHVSDRIALAYDTDDETAAVLLQHADYIKGQVLATSMDRRLVPVESAAVVNVGSGEAALVLINLKKV
jgi:isoleucyl-tRNA synthetase